jgi:predicted amidohydrolase
MLVACIQIEVKTCDVEVNTNKALEMAESAIDRGAEILVFPELFLTGFCYDMAPETKPYASLNPFRSLSEDHDCMIIGSIMVKGAGGRYNLGICIDREMEGTFTKAHPFGPEKDHFLGGSDISPITTSKVSIGLEICYDLRFPEVARALTIKGADLIVTIAQFPAERIAHWRTLCVARAIENQIPHVACNCAGADFAGNSMIIDSWGRIIAEADSNECIVTGQIDFDERDSLRQAIPCLADRRPEIY